MKTLKANFSKGPDDVGAWLEDFKGIYGAGSTALDAFDNLKECIALYVKHNQDAPQWLKESRYVIQYSIKEDQSFN